MTGAKDEKRDPGSEVGGSTGYLRVAVVFAVSCVLAAAGVALYDAGGPGALFGPRLEVYDPAATPPGSEEAEDASAPKTARDRDARAPAKERPRRAGTSSPGGAASPPAGLSPVPPEATSPEDLGNGRLMILCSRPCRVQVDGVIVGEANPRLSLVQPAGEHRVKVEELDGDDLRTRRILVAPNRERALTFMLGSKPPGKAFLRDLEGTEDWAR